MKNLELEHWNSNVNFCTGIFNNLERIQTPHSLFSSFRAEKTFTTC